MNRALFSLLILGVAAAGVLGLRLVRLPAETRPVTPGVSQELAHDRAARVSSLAYDVSLRIPASRTEAVQGRVTVTFALSDAARPLAFDFTQATNRLHKVTANGHTITPEVSRGHVVVRPEVLVRGENRVSFEFSAGDEALNRQNDFLYSLFVPARAALAFPCLDQPDLKARWRLTLDVPAGWTAVSNGRESGRLAAGGRISYLFEETAPLPTYLFAFAAGHFLVESAEREGRTFRMFHRETDPARISRNRDAIFDLHAKSLAWLERYTNVAYPFGKFDFVLIPSFQFGGMEHPGAVFYNASSLLLEEAATQNQHLARANVIAHESAHMWFGDLVTMTWFNDVWMKEVFANFMAAKIVNPSFPTINHPLRFLVQHHPVAYDVDRTDGANPIRQDLANLDDAGSLYGAIIYQKAPVVMRQLELLVGEAAFRDGLRRYLILHGFANAGWPDLIRILDASSPLDLAAWSHAWVAEAGRPTIETIVEIENGAVRRLALHQSDPRDRGLLWTQRLEVAVGRGEDVRLLQVATDAATVELPDAVGTPVPDWILPAAGGLGYAKFDLDARTVAFLAERLHEIRDPLTRGAALVALWECMLDGQVPVSSLRLTLTSALAAETNELNLQLVLDQLRALFWRFTPTGERAAFANALEPLLRDGLNRAATTSEKAAWFAALRSIATTSPTLDWLERIWARRARIPGLPLSEVDETDLAMDLSVRDRPSADAMLHTQLARITNPDRKARLEFVMPALSGDAAVRGTFFASLADPSQRTRETWVLEAVRYLHHPLRAGTSARLVRPALAMVLDIQRTGDIFFPKRWADATLGGYQSVETAADVQAFLNTLPPDYPTRLRWTLLSAADPLFRAARLLGH